MDPSYMTAPKSPSLFQAYISTDRLCALSVGVRLDRPPRFEAACGCRAGHRGPSERLLI